jgi:hypothetical protein
MLQFIKQNKYFSYSMISGLYGSMISLNGSYEQPNDVLGNRIVLCLLNGVCYSFLSPYYNLKLLNRIDIKLTGKDPTKYVDSYSDMYSYNKNVFI